MIEGLKLMIIGMGTVFIFLGLMVYVINLVAKLTAKYAEQELAEIALKKKDKRPGKKMAPPAAVISAAVAAYESDEKK